jgi:hypothetical protein
MNVKIYSLSLLLITSFHGIALAENHYDQSNYFVLLSDQAEDLSKASDQTTATPDLEKAPGKVSDLNTASKEPNNSEPISKESDQKAPDLEKAPGKVSDLNTASKEPNNSEPISKASDQTKPNEHAGKIDKDTSKQSLQEKYNKLKNYTIRYADDMPPYKGDQEQQIKSILTDVDSNKQNFYLFENDAEKILAVAHSIKEATALGQRARAVFYLQANQSLQQNLSRWAKSEDYQLVWQCQQDLNIQYASIIYGTFLGQGGALAQVLQSTKNTSMPLEAEVMANKVILMKPYAYNSQILTL